MRKYHRPVILRLPIIDYHFRRMIRKIPFDLLENKFETYLTRFMISLVSEKQIGYMWKHIFPSVVLFNLDNSSILFLNFKAVFFFCWRNFYFYMANSIFTFQFRLCLAIFHYYFIFIFESERKFYPRVWFLPFIIFQFHSFSTEKFHINQSYTLL